MSRYPAFPHEVVAVVFQVRDAKPKTTASAESSDATSAESSDANLCVLLWQRARSPYRGRWALPGGSLGERERLGASIARHLADKVDVAELAHLEQLETRSDPRRDPRGRELATAYLGLVPANQEPHLPDDTSWHVMDDLPAMAFDHGSIVESARDRLRAKLSYTSVGFALAPPEFTIAELRALYGAALGYPVSATNLQRVLLRRDVIVPTASRAASGPVGGRPARRYRFAQRDARVTDPFAILRPPRT